MDSTDLLYNPPIDEEKKKETKKKKLSMKDIFEVKKYCTCKGKKKCNLQKRHLI